MPGPRGTCAFYDSDFTIDGFIKRMLHAELQTVIGLDGFMPVSAFARDNASRCLNSRPFDALAHLACGCVIDPSCYSPFAVECGRMLEDALESLYPMGPYRRPPQRWYIFTGTSPQDVGYSGDLLPDLLYRRPQLVQDTNGWLDKLEIGYRIKVQSERHALVTCLRCG